MLLTYRLNTIGRLGLKQHSVHDDIWRHLRCGRELILLLVVLLHILLSVLTTEVFSIATTVR
jgi:hypothetical protein